MRLQKLFVTIGFLLLGAGCGWFFSPRYRPEQGSEEELKLRAAAYYGASKSFDYPVMSRLITPARQRAETDELLKKSVAFPRQFKTLPEEERADLVAAAESITAASISAEIDGDWAITTGTYLFRFSERVEELPLEKLVWVRDHGKWWMFEYTDDEVVSYGNPPDAALDLLTKVKQLKPRETVPAPAEEEPEAGQPAQP